MLLTLAEMYVQGDSTRKVASITERLCGTQISASQVSRACKQLDEELEAWLTRPLGEVLYLYLDARYEKVRQAGSVPALLARCLPPSARDFLGWASRARVSGGWSLKSEASVVKTPLTARSRGRGG